MKVYHCGKWIASYTRQFLVFCLLDASRAVSLSLFQKLSESLYFIIFSLLDWQSRYKDYFGEIKQHKTVFLISVWCLKNSTQFEMIIGKLCASCNNAAGIISHHSKKWVSYRTLHNFVDIVMASIYEYKKLSRPFFATEKDIIYFSNHYRSSRPKMFCKKGVLKNFTKFTGKHLCQS